MKALHKNIIREIQRTKSRFFSIFAIIALSTGFFSGIKGSSPTMLETGSRYFEENNLMDIRLISSIGFDDDDIDAIKELDCTTGVMPAYMADLIISRNNIDTVVRVHSLPEKSGKNTTKINEPSVIEGRLPNKDGECVMDSYYFTSLGFRLGDKLKFSEKVGDNDTLDYISDLEYKIVGSVSTPEYITYQRGNTNVGSGGISYFIMIRPEEFRYERYTNVYVKTNAADGISELSDEYKERIKKQQKQYKKLSEKRIKSFNETTLADARKKLEDGEKEYSDKKAEAEEKLADGEKKLYEGETELYDKLAEGEKTIQDSEKKLEEGKKELQDAQKKYSDGITEAKNKLTEAREKYDQGKKAYNDAKLEYDTQIDAAQTKLDDAQSEYNTQYTLFYGTTKPQAETKLTLLKSAIDVCNEGIEKTEDAIKKLEENVEFGGQAQTDMDELKTKLSEYKKKLKEYKKQYDDGIKALSDAEKQFNESRTKLDDAKTEFENKKAEGAVGLNDAQNQLDLALGQLENGRLEYETAMTTGMMELQAAQTQITQGEEELEKGKEELDTKKDEGLRALKSAREQLIKGRLDAKTGLDEAEKKLRDARKQLEALEGAKWIVYNRDDNPGYSGLVEDALRVDKVAAVFPVFFLLVAALVCLTTMTRMVEERRTEIGTLKALGYSDLSVSAKYFIYAASASVLGSAVGGVIGNLTLPYIIVNTYSMMYILPPPRLVIFWESFLFSSGLGLVCTCAVATAACLRELRLRPAMLMRPKAPKPGKRILLEYITPLWKMMNFTSKVTARNIFRYKARFLMTVIGVAGCTALIIGGMGLKDSISLVAQRQYGEISLYDQVYALSEPGSSEEKKYLMSQFRDDERFSETLLAYQGNTFVYYDDGKSKIDLRIIIPENKKTFSNMFILRNRSDSSPVSLDDSGIVITERLSQVIGCVPGDTAEFTIDDEHYRYKISGITENYAGNFIYMTPKLYKTITGKECEFNIVFTSVTESALAQEHEIANDWMKSDDIVTVSMINDQVGMIMSMMDSLNIIIVVLVICAGMLAMVVLYNLTNINIAERVREIATIKVLGFYNLETANYIYRENTILTLTGALAGIPIGTIFATFVIMAIQMDMVMFPQYVSPASYIFGFVLTIIFSLIVNFIMYFKMKKISMVESLKSIE